jgi:hypothetical protein
MNDIFEAKRLLEAATPENPVKFRVKDGTGQHLDIMVTDATVDIKPSMVDGEVDDPEESIDFNIKTF